VTAMVRRSSEPACVPIITRTSPCSACCDAVKTSCPSAAVRMTVARTSVGRSSATRRSAGCALSWPTPDVEAAELRR
jgi:hypothetical protein